MCITCIAITFVKWISSKTQKSYSEGLIIQSQVAREISLRNYFMKVRLYIDLKINVLNKLQVK